jgi:hypothetical protein
VEEHPILILVDLRRPCEEREPQGGRLGSRQGRVGQCVRPEGMMEDRGGARQQEPHGVGQDRRRRGPVAVEVTLDRLAIVFTIPSRALEVCIDHLGGRCLSGGDDKARLVPRGPACRFDNHAPRLGP